MSMLEHIRNKLSSSLTLHHIEVINESHLHNTPPDSESHFKAILVSEDFCQKMPVKRHQMIYCLLTEEMQNSIHALALHTYTPEEWSSRQQQAPSTPDCRGGSKH